jgi:hypothetical protein
MNEQTLSLSTGSAPGAGDVYAVQRRFLVVAGAGYGLTFGLAFAAAAWGYDALALATISADLFWLKLAVGLALLLPLSVAAGALVGRAPTLLSVGAWAVAGGLTGVVVGLTYFDGTNLGWLLDSRLRDTAALLADETARVVMIIQIVIGVIGGGLAGLFEPISLEGAWGHATRARRMSARSWVSFAACLPIALLLGAAADQLLNAPARVPLESIHADIQLLLDNPGSSVRPQVSETLWVNRTRLSRPYILYLVTAPIGIQNSAVLDVAFDRGGVLRCFAVGPQIGGCKDAANVYQGWMDQVVRAGLSSDLTPLLCKTCEWTVNRPVLAWLDMHRQDFIPGYTIQKERQLAGWVIMSVQFDSGRRVECRFRRAMPVILDRCWDPSRP